MDHLLKQLCQLLDEELERQETVLAVCRAQREAALCHDIAGLTARNTALELLIRDAARAQGVRTALLRQVSEECGLARDGQSLSGVIAMASEPWARRLRDLQRALGVVLGDIRRVAQSNTALLRSSARAVDRLLALAEGAESSAGGGYDAQGREPVTQRRAPVLINQAG